jgi:hypothetical protein
MNPNVSPCFIIRDPNDTGDYLAGARSSVIPIQEPSLPTTVYLWARFWSIAGFKGIIKHSATFSLKAPARFFPISIAPLFPGY